MRKILIIKFSAIGDVVESLPVAAALKELYKDGSFSYRKTIRRNSF